MFQRKRVRRQGAIVVLTAVTFAGVAVAQTPAGRPAPSQAPAAKTSVSPSHTSPVVIAPHRAIYEISLDQARNAASVTEMSGRMVYELTGSSCEGYSQSMRFVSRMGSQDGSTTVTDMRSSSWEDAAAKTLRFNSSQYKDSKLSETTQGEAARDAKSGEVKVDVVRPTKKELTLKPGAYYPVQHSIAMLAAARRGETVFQADLYDGSEKGEKVYSTTTFIGAVRPAGHNATLPAVPSATPLDALRSWPVSISYFEAGSDKKDAVPAYELAFVYFENGVSRRLFIDYGDFAIRGVLKEITFHEPSKCDAK
jgi:EipB-like